MKDFTVRKPSAIAGYPLHRAVAALTKGAPHLWRDNGDTIAVRTTAPLDAEGTDLPELSPGELRMFTLRACVGAKVRGRHRYPPVGDHRTRQEWLTRQALRHGFELLAVHSRSQMCRVNDEQGRNFMLDSTDFTGVLKVIDPAAVSEAMRSGVGSTGKAFGFSMLTL